MSISETLIEYIRENRFSTTEIADSLSKTGAIPKLFPVCKGSYAVGLARCLFTANGSNFYLHEQLDLIQPGEIALVFSKYCEGQAVFGDIVAKYMLSVRRAEGIVVQGEMRDATELAERNYPLWCNGYTPIGCINKPTSPFPWEDQEALELRYTNAILVCDDCGVVAIPKEHHNLAMKDRLEGLRLQEEVWNFCIDELGWNTERTICAKDYLNHLDLLPEAYREKEHLLRINFATKP